MSDTPTRKKSGPRPKTLKTGTYTGIEIGRGDKKHIVDPQEVEKLASIGMKHTDIADWFGVDDQTLRSNFQQELTKGRLRLNQSLRQAQITLALGGNAVMLIWLGKNLLGQSDAPLTQDTENQVLPWNNTE